MSVLEVAVGRSSDAMRSRVAALRRARRRTTSRPRSRCSGRCSSSRPRSTRSPPASRSDDFFLPAHREIFEAMLAIDKRRQAIDVIAVADELKTHGMLARLDGGAELPQRSGQRRPTAENVAALRAHGAREVDAAAADRDVRRGPVDGLRRLRRVRDLPRRGRDQDLQGRPAEPARDLLRRPAS